MKGQYAQFCNGEGVTLMGTDSLVFIDRRYGLLRRDISVASVRSRFHKHMPAKWSEMTHYVYEGVIRAVPQNASMPHAIL